MNIFKPRLRLVKGTRFVSFLFIGCSILIAAGILIAANMYYNIDTGEIVMSEIQRMTGVLRATAGVIVGGGPTQDPTAGYDFEVIGQSRLATTTFATGTVELIAANQLLKFTGGVSGYYVGIQADTSATSGQAITYTLPAAKPTSENFVLTSQTDGTLVWESVGDTGAITAVGDVTSGSLAFTSNVGEQYGTTLWFHRGSNLGALTIDTLSANATYTLPAISGTNYLTLTATSTLANAGVLFADASGLITQDSNFTYSSDRLQVGSNGIRLLGSTSGYIDLKAAATSDNTTYTWPNTVVGGMLLKTDASGNLSWDSPGGAGGVEGSGVAGRVAFWVSSGRIESDSGFTFSTSTGKLTLDDGLITPLIQASNTLTLQSLNGNIVLYPSTGIVQLGTSTYIETASGYKIGATGTEVLREMIPIMGFDLPVRTATSGMVQISRTIDNYPVSSCTDGTSRLHKLVIRYGSTGTTTWQVATSSTGYTSFDLPPTNSTTTGTVHTATTSIPTPAGACTGWIQNSATDDWWVRVNPGGNDTMIYQIFLAAYDQIQ